jgi:hypothetical protein
VRSPGLMLDDGFFVRYKSQAGFGAHGVSSRCDRLGEGCQAQSRELADLVTDSNLGR